MIRSVGSGVLFTPDVSSDSDTSAAAGVTLLHTLAKCPFYGTFTFNSTRGTTRSRVLLIATKEAFFGYSIE